MKGINGVIFSRSNSAYHQKLISAACFQPRKLNVIYEKESTFLDCILFRRVKWWLDAVAFHRSGSLLLTNETDESRLKSVMMRTNLP